MIGYAILGGSIIILGGYTINVYNTIQLAKNDYEEKGAEILSEYQRRLDMLGNSVKTTKGSATFEKETLTLITQARAGINKDTKISDRVFKGMEKTMMKLHAQIEAYPQLQSTKLFETLQKQIEDTENRIYESRNELNEIARDYNTYINTIPSMWFAKMFKAEKMTYFEPSDKAKTPSYSIEM